MCIRDSINAEYGVCAMIAIDMNTVGNWAEKLGLAYTNYMDLTHKQEVRDLILDEIRRINPSLPEVSRIKRFLLLAKDLDACLLYTSDAADDLLCVDLGGRRIIKKKKLR
eukprot:TRINITY_DN21030_c0_g1_i1.p1 TRINITY_DN21030_c0_g1~~TRINITY_DN21030_c0_g1_i1.p1  ORF type:complete len:110 (+),score=57.01 TRINITY_DN21030_c0_g1_i1:131-460(+)